MTRTERGGARWSRLAWGAVLAVIALVGLVAAGRRWAAGVESSARRAWDATLPVASLALPRPVTDANATALQLEENAARIGIALAPRASRRFHPVIAIGGALDTLHADLVAQLGVDPPPSVAPALAAWLEMRGPALDALAVDLVASAPPRWESPRGRVIVRSPAPLQRCDRLVLEAARLASIPEGAALSAADAHLARPGTPRLDGVALLEESLLLVALNEGRAGDGQFALRALAAAARLEEGLCEEGDILTLGVVSNLGRLRLAVLRDLALPVAPEPLLGPALEPRFRQALVGEAGEWARELGDPPLRSGLVARLVHVVLEPAARAAGARTLENLHRIATALDGTRLPDADLARLASDVAASAPAWDGIQGDYLGEIVGVWSRLRRADVEAEMTRRFLRARQLLSLTGDEMTSCQQAAAGRGERAPDAFRCASDDMGRLALVATGAGPGIGRPAPFEPTLSTPISSRR